MLCGAGAADSTATNPAAATAGTAGFPDFDDLGLGQAAVSVTDGIQGIAGGLEALLGRLSVRATRVAVRLELPTAPGSAAAGQPAEGSSACSVAVLRLAEVAYGGGSAPEAAPQWHGDDRKTAECQWGAPQPAAAQGEEPHRKAYKHAHFSGLTVELYEDGEEPEDEAGAASAATADQGASCVVEMPSPGSAAPETAWPPPESSGSKTDDSAHVIICSPEGIGYPPPSPTRASCGVLALDKTLQSACAILQWECELQLSGACSPHRCLGLQYFWDFSKALNPAPTGRPKAGCWPCSDLPHAVCDIN